MSFPFFIFTLLGFVLSVFIAFLIYSIFYPEAIENPLIIWDRFNLYRVVLKQKHEDYLILKQEKLLEQQERLKRNQEEKDKVVFPAVVRTPITVQVEKDSIALKNNVLVKSTASVCSKSQDWSHQVATIENTIFLSGGIGGFIEVVGESQYQKALKEAKKSSAMGTKYLELFVGVEPEPNNQHDSNAVRVHWLDETLGYLTRTGAKVFLKSHKDAIDDGRPILCNGYLTGGMEGKPDLGIMVSFNIYEEKRRKTWGITVNNIAVKSKQMAVKFSNASKNVLNDNLEDDLEIDSIINGSVPIKATRSPAKVSEALSSNIRQYTCPKCNQNVRIRSEGTAMSFSCPVCQSPLGTCHSLDFLLHFDKTFGVQCRKCNCYATVPTGTLLAMFYCPVCKDRLPLIPSIGVLATPPIPAVSRPYQYQPIPVKSHRRKNGTWVSGHARKSPRKRR